MSNWLFMLCRWLLNGNCSDRMSICNITSAISRHSHFPRTECSRTGRLIGLSVCQFVCTCLWIGMCRHRTADADATNDVIAATGSESRPTPPPSVRGEAAIKVMSHRVTNRSCLGRRGHSLLVQSGRKYRRQRSLCELVICIALVALILLTDSYTRDIIEKIHFISQQSFFLGRYPQFSNFPNCLSRSKIIFSGRWSRIIHSCREQSIAGHCPPDPASDINVWVGWTT